MNLGELTRRAWYFLNRDRITRELEEEMRIHVEFRAESLRKHDVGESLAYAAARRRFGNATTFQERSRDMWGGNAFEEFAHDLKFAVCRLTQRPAFTAAVVGVMAIGIGATTAMFSAVDAALLRPLPFANPEQLVTAPVLRVPLDPGPGNTFRMQRVFDVVNARASTDIFSSVAVYAAGGLNLADPENPMRVKVGVVTDNFFSTLGVSPFRGRVFTGNEGVPNGPDVAVLSYGLWQRQFGGRDTKGLRITLSSRSFEVIGVMPRGFGFPEESDLWIPMTVPTTFQTFAAFRGFLPTTVVARIAPSLTVASASARLLSAFEQARATMDTAPMSAMIKRSKESGALMPLQQRLVGDRHTALYVLLGATGLLLLVACVNVTNLLLSHAVIRQRELTLRQVLGATRARLVRQLLTESVVLSASGAIIGLAIAPAALQIVRALMPSSLAGVASATIDLRVLAFATALAVLTGVLFGLWPALGSTRTSHTDSIKSGSGHGATARGTGGLRRALVSAELALTVMLLIGAALMLRSFDELLNTDSGMRTERVGTLEMALTWKQGPTVQADAVARIEAVLAQLRNMPGVTSAGVVNDLPLSGAGGMALTIDVDGYTKRDDGQALFARFLQASSGYFETMGIPLLEGRLFTARDNASAPSVVIISNTMAKKFWPGVSPIGRTFRLTGAPPMTIVGVVADVRESKLEERADWQMYVPVYADAPVALALVARGNVSDKTLLSYLREAVRSVDKSQAFYNVRMMDDVVSKAVAPRRTNTILIAAFAALALILAAVGVYAVVSHSVSHRRRELGIRSALGATGADLLSLISREMIGITVIGVAVGLGGAWALAHTLSSLVYSVQVHDITSFIIVPLTIIVPIVLATLMPARRATRVNPVEVMRAE